MKVDLHPKKIHALFPTDILFQTTYWSKVKSILGWKPIAFDFQTSVGYHGDILVLIRSIGRNLAYACVPQGPENGPDPENYGLFLEALSNEIRKYLDPAVAFIRYDLPWKSLYALDTAKGQHCFLNYSPQLQELRMNIGTHSWNLRKAPFDLTVADTVMIDLTNSEETILKLMKPKTRYNIRLAQRKGVSVFNASVEMLPLFYKIYLQTAERNGFTPATYVYFKTLFTTLIANPGLSEILFVLAARGSDILAGAITVITNQRATYLFGGSSNKYRHLMGPYALHWESIKLAQRKGCVKYDMGSVSPIPDPSHPFYGMYRFKTGFGGKVVHRNGSWDYPFNLNKYKTFRNYESLNVLRRPESHSQ